MIGLFGIEEFMVRLVGLTKRPKVIRCKEIFEKMEDAYNESKSIIIIFLKKHGNMNMVYKGNGN